MNVTIESLRPTLVGVAGSLSFVLVECRFSGESRISNASGNSEVNMRKITTTSPSPLSSFSFSSSSSSSSSSFSSSSSSSSSSPTTDKLRSRGKCHTNPIRKFSTEFPTLVYLLLLLIIIILPNTIHCLDNVCQATTPTNTTAYYVCMGDPMKVLSPNTTNYILNVVPPEMTCGVSLQPYCTMTTPMQCGNCSNSIPALSHPKEFMVDIKDTGSPNLDTSWQSLTWRAYGKVPQADIVLNMGRRYILQDDLKLTFASLRPKQAILEKSMDNGVTWFALQYYNYTCSPSFKTTIVNPDDVICTQEYSLGSSSAELKFQVNRDRLKAFLGESYNNFENLYNAYQETNLLEFLTFTDLRLRLLYPATDGQEINGRPADKLKYYYAVSDIYLIAGCDCNRHAKFCKLQGNRMVCTCEHNTMGDSCEMCLPMYNNKPWQKGSFLPAPTGTANECQICDCFGRASNCTFDPTIGRGRCIGCLNNTQGDSCTTCVTGFYRNLSLALNDPTLCTVCNCEPTGLSQGSTTCQESGGQCACKANVMGRRCDSCYDELWGLLTNDTSRGTCKPCNCNTAWTIDGKRTCDQNTGQCFCVSGVDSKDCSLCADGYFRNTAMNYPKCDPCLCDLGGSSSFACDKQSSQCPCRPSMIGSRCHFVNSGFYIPLPDRINLKPDNSTATTCQLQTDIIRPTAPFTGGYFYSCGPLQVAAFNDFLSSIKHQGGVVQSYIPAIRYSLNDSKSFAHATLTIIPSPGQNTNFNVTHYPNLTTTTCDPSYPQVTFDLFDMTPGFGTAWINMTARINLDARCQYRAEFKTTDPGATTSPFLLDSLVLVPDYNQSLAYTRETSEAMRVLYEICLRHSIPLYSSTPINDSSLAFCMDFLQSMMTEQTGEALPCDCDTVGSIIAVNCTTLGGQCACKVNVGGRRCDRCLPGFFGFSNTGCQACDCNSNGSSSLVCDYTSGQCPCRPNVALLGDNTTETYQVGGRQCALCKKDFYGVTSGQGCQTCNCNVMGSLASQCFENGTCPCKPTIGGNKCDRCITGYTGFSADGCKTCNCSSSGSISGTCDGVGQCDCKTNVQGQKCDQCKAGTFALSPTNPDGCQPCFCSGKSSTTTPCSSAAGFRQDVISSPDTSGWPVAPDMLSYVLAPAQFLGDKRSSYGQWLNFTAIPSTSFMAGLVQYVILESTDGRRISYSLNNVSFAAFQPMSLSVQLQERFWMNDTSTTNVTANDMYWVLSRLSKLMLQQRFLDALSIPLSLISLISSTPSTDGTAATINSVENCTCIDNTAGLSCEKCQQGFKRASNDSGAQCMPCTCKFISQSNMTCDQFTGKCLNCSNGSLGWNCEQLAANVEIGADGSSLKCKQGFWGLSQSGCQACTCHPIGSSDTTKCDPVTGACACRTKVGGLNCDRCEDGYVNMTMVGCSECNACYKLAVAELNILLGMSKNQTDVFFKVSSSSAPGFSDRLVQAEVTSTFLNKFNIDFASERDTYNKSLERVIAMYWLLDIIINRTLDSLSLDMKDLLTDVQSILTDTEASYREASMTVYAIYNSLPYLTNVSDALLILTLNLEQIDGPMKNSIFPLQYGYSVLNDTVSNIENMAQTTSILTSNLSNIMQQVLSNGQQLNSSIITIEGGVNQLNASATTLKIQTTNVKNQGADLINRTSQAYNMVANVNSSALPDMQGLSTNLSLTLPNIAASQQTTANNLIGQSTALGQQVQDISQMTSALVARVADFQNQVNAMTTRVSAANQTTNNAVNQSITTFNNAVVMLDVMRNFPDRANSLMVQANSAIQTANTISANSQNALNLASNMSISIDPIIPIASQALDMSNNTLSRCLDFYQSSGPVLDRSNQLKIMSDNQLNDVPFRQNAVSAIAQTAGNEATIANQNVIASDMSNHARAVRDLANQLSKNVTSVSQRIADLSARLNSMSPLTTTNLNTMLSQCQGYKVSVNQLVASNTPQNLQTISSTNEQWIGGLVGKRQELTTQLSRLNTIIGRLTKI